jgi:hypothetical protein
MTVQDITKRLSIPSDVVISNVCDSVSEATGIECVYSRDGFIPMTGKRTRCFGIAVENALEDWAK